LSLPLPTDHWLYAERTYGKPDQVEPDELPEPILTHAQRAAVVAAVRYAVRGATMCGKDADFDPDALVQNAVYALCGPFGIDRLAGDWRADVQKVRDALDPEDWCGDESMIAALDRALGQPSAPTAEQAEGVRVGSETWNVLRLCVTELSGWMRNYGQDLRSQEAVKRARALLAAPAASTGDQV
jgi:hypothetical protein